MAGNEPRRTWILILGSALILACGALAWVRFRGSHTRSEAARTEQSVQPSTVSRAPSGASKAEAQFERPAPASAAGDSREASPRKAVDFMKTVLRREKGGESEDREAALADPAAVLMDPDAPPGSRRRAAWLLARRGDEEALRVLEQVFPDSPAALKAVIAEALGYAKTPAAREMLLRIFSSESDEAVLRGAVRGIAALGGSEGVELLAGALHSPERSLAVRIEAAEALGAVGSPQALKMLVDSYQFFSSADGALDRDLLRGVLGGLGRRDISETREFFEALLDSPGTDREVRLASVEALEQASGEVGPFLVKYLRDPDPDVRAAVAWSLAMAEEPGQISEDLAAILAQEEVAEVRSRIYQALENQEAIDSTAVLERALAETEPAARLAASSFLADRIAMGVGGAVREQFDAAMVPELVEVALSDRDLDEKLKAVLALRRASTEASLEALRDIANRSTEARIVQAAKTGLGGR